MQGVDGWAGAWEFWVTHQRARRIKVPIIAAKVSQEEKDSTKATVDEDRKHAIVRSRARRTLRPVLHAVTAARYPSVAAVVLGAREEVSIYAKR